MQTYNGNADAETVTRFGLRKFMAQLQQSGSRQGDVFMLYKQVEQIAHSLCAMELMHIMLTYFIPDLSSNAIRRVTLPHNSTSTITQRVCTH